jgi:hypothetical protein
VLPPNDTKYLAERVLDHSVISDGGMTCVLFPQFPLPQGFQQNASDLLLRLNTGYPDVPPDMWWFDPPVLRADGQPIPQTEVIELHLGRNWQRWSRHLEPTQWRSGIDSIESFLALLRRELERSAPAVKQP